MEKVGDSTGDSELQANDLVKRLAACALARCLALCPARRHARASSSPVAQLRRSRSPRRRRRRRGRSALLRSARDVNAPNADGTTALHWAVHHDDLDARRSALMRAGANVERDERLRRDAAVGGRVDRQRRRARARCSRRAPTSRSPNADGQTALMIVARTGPRRGGGSAAERTARRSSARAVARPDGAHVGGRRRASPRW